MDLLSDELNVLGQNLMGPRAVDALSRNTNTEPLPWHAVRVRSNFEWVTASLLREKGYEEFLPVYQAKVRYSDRMKTTEKPLFPGYVFCRFDPDRRVPVLSTPGVVQVVGIGKRPVAIDEQEMEAIQMIARSGETAMPWPHLRVGQRVVLEKGPLTGLEGILVEVKNCWRIVVTVSLLQRSIAAEVERDWIRPLSGIPCRKSIPAISGVISMAGPASSVR